MLVVGLTGNIASGKSTVARLLAERGARIIDSDVLARRAVAPGTPVLAAITRRWGTSFLRTDGSLDRAALRSLVFQDRAELAALNAIVHPEVERLRQQELRVARERGDQVVVCDIPLLFEVGLDASMDRVIFVDAPPAVRLDRLIDTRKISRDDAVAMMAAQQPAESKRHRANYVVDNAGTIEALRERVDTIWSALIDESRARTS